MVRILVPLTGFLFLNSIAVLYCDNLKHKHRVRRRIVFSKSSKFFFRLNGKDNVVNHTEIFAHGWAFRVNYDLPESIPKRHQFFKRDVDSELDIFSNNSNLDVYSCILKYVCESVNNIKRTRECGILCGIGDIISRTATVEANFFKSFLNNCEYHTSNCPYISDSIIGT